MILIITTNPLLENRLYCTNFKNGENHRNVEQCQTAGGKGINVSRQLQFLGIKSLNFIFLGTHNGKRYRELLEAEGLSVAAVRTSDDTRSATVIVEPDTKRVTTLFCPNSTLKDSEVEEFKQKLPKMIQNCEIVLFSGSSPSPAADSIFPYGIQLANQYDKISVLDTYGEHLQNCLTSSPTIVHNNLQEIESSLNINLQTEEEILTHLHSLYEKGVKQAFLTNGGLPFYASNFDFTFKIENPTVTPFDETGSGDAFTAGLIYGHYYDAIFDDTIRLASALGAVNATQDTVCEVTKEEAEPLASSVTITPIGKRMKIVDVTPTI